MARDSDLARDHTTLIDAGFLWMSKAASGLIAAVKYFFTRPFKPGTDTRPIPLPPPPKLEGNLTLVRLLAASRILLFPKRFAELWRLGFLHSYFGHAENPDKFFFLTHHFYLSKGFTPRQRITSAVSHYSHESRSCGPGYHQAVYRSPEGLTLWHRNVNGTPYSLSLRATEDFRNEGDLSIFCLVGDVRVCRLSFSYVQGTVFGIDAPMTLFVTRNQSDRNAELQRFRADFKQNSPPYFCVAAVSGIAMAHGIRRICLIQEEAQIAYDPRFAQSFRNSYTAFWEVFGAKEICAHSAYIMAVPLELNPIASVKHRSRASSRRQNWLEIMVNARQAILEHRVTGCPEPIDVETSTLLRTQSPH
jgi:uncharacterized protein VirK/YbjX